MSITTHHLLEKGYFTDELPPPFHTQDIATHQAAIKNHFATFSKADRDKINETLPVLFSTPKTGIYRRMMALPNPIHQLPLSELIASHWEEIRTYWKSAGLSASTPIFKIKDKRAIIQISKYQAFKEKCISVSYDRSYELKADVSKYFPSIYTHSIPWALHTKAVAKSKSGREVKSLGNMLDKAVRSGQSGQTKGIPIGTDTSRIIAEIVGTGLDIDLIAAFKKDGINYMGYRFIDDYQLYFHSAADAEKALKILHKVLNNYSLDLNDEKTIINSAPYKLDNDWSYLLNSCPLRDKEESIQAHDLITYVNLVIDMAIKHPADYVIKYGIKRLLKTEIFPDNWSLLEALILKLGTYEPAALPSVAVFLLQNKLEVNKDRIKNFVQNLLQQRISRGHHFEVAWSLWIAKQFHIEIPKDLAQQIIDSRDVISILILLDMQDNSLVSFDLDLKDLKSEFTEENLYNELWLLIYEATHKKWISSTAVSDSFYFQKLNALKVSFYDTDAELEIGETNVMDSISEKEFAGLKFHTRSKTQKFKKSGRKVKVGSDY